ncbi:MAG TPA: phosphopantetheine-binding protein [Thermoanaerobaculia bacterium]|nr:phosphopantetheine-binding protein [Thermoanaerobaculia bacterium]
MDPRIADEVRMRFGRLMKIDPQGVDLHARLDDVYRVSSFNHLRLINELEVALGIDIPEAEGKRAWTLAELIELCERSAA